MAETGLKIETIQPGDGKVLIHYFFTYTKRPSQKKEIRLQFIMMEHFQMEKNLTAAVIKKDHLFSIYKKAKLLEDGMRVLHKCH